MSTRIEGSAAAEWRAHWPVVMAAMAGMAVASLISYSSGLFIEPLEKEFGWSRAEIAAGHSIAATARRHLRAVHGHFCRPVRPTPDRHCRDHRRVRRHCPVQPDRPEHLALVGACGCC